MSNATYKFGQRVYHLHFGWASVHIGIGADDKILIDLDCKELSYYVMGKGYKTVREDANGHNYLRCPVSEIFDSPYDVPNDTMTQLRKMSLNATIKT